MDIRIGNRIIGEDEPCFIVAEISANHLHNFELAVKTIQAARDSGADAVKVQTLTADTMTINCNNKYFRIKGNTPWDGKTYYELYSQTPMPWSWHRELKKVARDLGLVFFSTPYDKTAVDFLEGLGMTAYKIASFEITDIPLIKYIALKKKPVIISTGVAKLSEIEGAVRVCRKHGNNKIILLKCVSLYPAPLEEINLLSMKYLKKAFNVIVGLSDHSLEPSVPIASVALGAKVIEKHIILDRSLGGPDAAFSLEPAEFKAMVQDIRDIEKALGEEKYRLSDKMKESRRFCRSLFAVDDIKKGSRFNPKNVRSIRPGFGLPPKYLGGIVGRKATKDIKKGTPLKWSMIRGMSR